MILNKSLVDFPYFIKLFVPLSYLGPAFFYMYVKAFIYDRSFFSKSDWVHIIPLVISIIDFLPIFFHSSSELNQIIRDIVSNKSFFYNEKIGFFSGAESLILRQIVFTIYFVLAGFMIFRPHSKDQMEKQPVQYRWLVFVFSSMFVLQVLRFTLAYISDRNDKIDTTLISMGGVLGTFITTGILLYLLYNPRLLYGFIFVGGENRNSTVLTGLEVPDNLSEKTNKVIEYFSAEEIEKHKSEIIQLMTDERPYLKPDCRIGQLAEKLNMPVHHCSYLINYEFNKNFRDWINSYRIAYFVDHFQSNADKMTIEALAAESGFSTPATFYNAFKKEKGMSPTAFFRQVNL